MRRKWDVSNKQARKKCIDEVITRLEEQGGTDFGRLSAEDIIEIVLQNLAPDIYNLAIKDAQKLIQQKISDLEIDLDLLNNSN